MRDVVRRAVGVAVLERVVGPLVRLRNVAGWLVAVAAVLAAAGGRAGRRAAARGLLAAGGSAVVVNGALKPLVAWRRPTPTLRSRLLTRASTRAPWSFPSSHSASTAAFATAAVMELGWGGTPFVLGAGAIGYSRVYGRVHRPIDVAAGAAVGTAIALGTTRWWPRAPRHVEHTDHARGHVDPTFDGEGVVVVANADAGPAVLPSPASRLERDLPKAKIVEAASAGEFEATLRHAVDGARAIGVVGGDGTVNAGAAIAYERELPLLVVPGGTLNHFARDVGVDSADDAVDAVRTGAVLEVEVGTIDGRPFVNTASIGSYVDLVDARERLERRLGKWLAVAVALVQVLRRAAPVEVEIDGRGRRVWMVFVGNGCYQPSGFAPSRRDRLDDGLLDVRLIDASEPWSRLRLVAAVLTGTVARSHVYEAWTAERVRVRSLDGPVRAARDGETFDAADDFEITKLPRRLQVYAPDRS